MNVQNASSVDTNISQTLEKESNNAIERKPDQSKKKSREISAVAGATPLDNKIDEPDALQSVTNQIQNSRPSVEMTQTTHNNHIEDAMMIEDQERMPEPTAHNGDSKSFQSSRHENKVDGEAMQMNFANATDVSDNGESSNKVTMEYVDKCLSCLARLETPIIKISGVGPKTEQAFHKLGIFTLRDLLWHFPRSFIDRSKLHKNVNDVPDGEIGTFRVMVHADRIRHNTVPCTDESGNNFDVTFFFGRSRQGGIMASTASANLCKNGTSLMIVSGKVTHSDKGAGIFNPDIVVPVDEADSVLGIEPVYGVLHDKLDFAFFGIGLNLPLLLGCIFVYAY